MLDDFILRALLGGAGVALAAGPLGCLVVWRRMAYFGDSLAHSALLGVALATLLGISFNAGMLAVFVLFAMLLVQLQRRRDLATDTLLGILSHAALSLGLVAISFMEGVRVDLLGFLFGDILSVTWGDLIWIYAGGGAALGVLALNWQNLLAITIHEELALAEGVPVVMTRLVFMLLIALVIVIAMKIVGMLLITALLIIPAATARRFSRTPEQMAVLAALIGCAAVMGGVASSMVWDTPSGPSVVVVAALLFLGSMGLGRERGGG